MKWLGRLAEHNLRSAELLFSLTINTARTNSDQEYVNRFGEVYESLVTARRNLALFQHNDAITGKLFTS